MFQFGLICIFVNKIIWLSFQNPIIIIVIIIHEEEEEEEEERGLACGWVSEWVWIHSNRGDGDPLVKTLGLSLHKVHTPTDLAHFWSTLNLHYDHKQFISEKPLQTVKCSHHNDRRT